MLYPVLYDASNFQQWPTLIDSLMSNVTAGVPADPVAAEQVLLGKESSLEALGYICQDAPVSVLETKSNAILTAIVHGMRAECPTQIRLAATNALLNSLEFTKHNFEKEVSTLGWMLAPLVLATRSLTPISLFRTSATS
jgi:hypothetical protein